MRALTAADCNAINAKLSVVRSTSSVNVLRSNTGEISLLPAPAAPQRLPCSSHPHRAARVPRGASPPSGLGTKARSRSAGNGSLQLVLENKSPCGGCCVWWVISERAGGREQAVGTPRARAGPQTEGRRHSSWLGDSLRKAPFEASVKLFVRMWEVKPWDLAPSVSYMHQKGTAAATNFVVLHLQPDTVISPHVKVLAVPKTKGRHKEDTARPISEVPSKGQEARDTNCSKRNF